ncbi:phosphoserine phosphatase SerB [Methylobrevis pamukkalensis]|uniref:Phosphoserine phosphatase n=1 Tax=Methylobrevis pamukkalensis TaxID=1439726 RepID=A0A1E3H353_9HYPH|nr:phosphoserine phosphatase SerB [Methylobrevis pamukkalensis]ODN70730.1 Phosphoserine phosphatase [Methylobrevis pamukkalensis]
MPLVATLVASPHTAAVTDSLIAAAARAVKAEATTVLAPAIAVDLLLPSGADAATSRQSLRDVIGDAPVDVVVQNAATRCKALFLADMDSTMIGQECIDELAAEVGLKDHISAITERAMRGEIEFEPALRERVALLKGLPSEVVTRVIESRIRLTPGGPELVRTMRAYGAYTALVSGGFTVFTGPVAALIGFHEDRANLLVEEDGRLTGEVAEPILGREAKLQTLVELRDHLCLADTATMAVGDGANDLAMIGAAGLGVAYHAKPKVAAAAHARIDHADLTALLYIQGYSRAEFVE